MRGIAKRAAARFLALAAVFMFALAICIAATTQEADAVETEYVSEIYFTYDPDTVVLNTAYTEDEIYGIASDNLKFSSGFYVRGGKGMFFKYVDGDGNAHWWSCSGDDPLAVDEEYAIGVCAIDVWSTESNPRDWNDAFYACTDFTLSGDCSGFNVYVNGEKRSDVIMKCDPSDGAADFYIPMGPVSTEPVIKTVTIEGNEVSMKVGTSHQFTATVTGNAANTTVSWSVSGANSTSTSISNAGLLTIGNDESAETILVTARSNANNKKFDTKTVTVLPEDPVIDSVEVSPSETSVFAGFSCRFTADVTGTEADKSVIWSVSGAADLGTTISDDGILTIARDETANALTVTATSVKDPTKRGTATVTVKPIEKLSAIYFTYDTGEINLNRDITEGELHEIARVGLKHTPENTFYIRGGKGLFVKCDYGEGNVEWSMLYGSENRVNPENEYAIGVHMIDVGPAPGKDWNDAFYACNEYMLSGDCSGFDVYVNGEKRDDVIMKCDPSDGGSDFFIPLKFKAGWNKIDGYWYFFDDDGTMVTNKWKKDSKGWCYLGADGKMVTNGWAEDSHGMCWIGANGYMDTGTKWVKYDGDWYHITKGYMDKSNWFKDSKGWCYVGADGKMVTNDWAKDSKGWCWIGSNGYMVTSTKWMKIGDDWYHITKGYRDQSKWMKDSHGWCYLGADGKMVTNGWAKDSKGWCWMGDDGYWVSDMWVEDGGAKYYIKSNHYMAKSEWIKIDGDWYYFKAGGQMVTGEFTIGDETYTFGDDGKWIS